jgi:hypothetical protein
MARRRPRPRKKPPLSRSRPRKKPARAPRRRAAASAAELSGAELSGAATAGAMVAGTLTTWRRQRDGRGRPVKLSPATFQQHVAAYPDLSVTQRAKRLAVSPRTVRRRRDKLEGRTD